tara:strand:- start:33 stop:290 length:258 start_codon:yes stop_codon:yes gene_type:complete
MPEINVRVKQNSTTNVRLGSQNAIKVASTSGAGAGGSLSQLDDVDQTGVQNGMVFVYNSSISKWQATMQLTPGADQNLVIDGGIF